MEGKWSGAEYVIEGEPEPSRLLPVLGVPLPGERPTPEGHPEPGERQVTRHGQAGRAAGDG